MIHDYNENMNYYHSNMRQIIYTLQPRIENRNYMNYYRQPYQHTNDYSTNDYHHLNAQNINYSNNENDHSRRWFTNTFQRIRNNFQNNFEDVIVRPTNFQIENAIENFIYDPSFVTGQNVTGQNVTNSYPILSRLETPNCPITMEAISPGNIVSRIKHCNHVFSHDALLNWFSVNTRCPICRFDIRETPINLSSVNETSTTQPTSVQSPTEQEQIDILENELNNLFDDSLPSTPVTQYQQIDSVQLPVQVPTQPVGNSWRNITNTLRTFLQNELQNNPATAELMYTFDIPLLFDSSSNNVI
jgi:hypothetical protein